MNKTIKQILSRLSAREKSVLIGGTIAIVMVVLYFWVDAPLLRLIDEKKQAINKAQTELVWMTAAKNKLLQLRANHASRLQPMTNVMSGVETSLAQQQLAKYIQSVQQPQAGQVQLALKGVPFDSFMTWLQGLLQQYQLNVLDLNVTAQKTLGVVDVAITIA